MSGRKKAGQSGDMETLRTRECTSIADLPDSVLSAIFSILHADPKGGIRVLRCMEVCKQWRGVVASMELSLTVPSWFSPRTASTWVSRFPNLRRLTLRSRRPVKFDVPAFFERLGRDCTQLRELEFDVNLRGLNRAAAPSISHFQLALLENLARLETLHIENVYVTKDPRPHTPRLTNLRSLTLKNCSGIQTLPPIHSLPILGLVEIHGLKSLRTPFELYALPSLHTLKIFKCPVQTLRTLRLRDIPSLLTLALSLDPGLDTPLHPIPDLGRLTNLRSLCLSHLTPEQSADIAHLTLLEALSVDATMEQPLSYLPQLTNLRQLCIHGHHQSAAQPQPLPSLDTISSLTRLEIQHLSAFSNGNERLQDLVNLGTSLDVSLMDSAHSFVSWGFAFTGLTQLNLDRMGAVNDDVFSSALGGLPALVNLSLSAERTSPPQLLVSLPCLKDLQVSNFGHGEFSLRENFPALTSLSLRLLDGVVIESLAGALGSLEKLKMYGCLMWALPPLAPLRSLCSLEISACERLSEIPSLEGLDALKKIEVDDCPDLVRISSLSGLSSLEELFLLHLDRLGAVPPLDGLARLGALEIYNCDEIRHLPELSPLVSLRTLDVGGCVNLERLPSLRGLSLLAFVNLRNCNRLMAAPDRDGLSEDLEIQLPRALSGL